jgi:hypothetical protein
VATVSRAVAAKPHRGAPGYTAQTMLVMLWHPAQTGIAPASILAGIRTMLA